MQGPAGFLDCKARASPRARGLSSSDSRRPFPVSWPCEYQHIAGRTLNTRLRFITLAVLAVLTATATAADFHVAPNGNDANPGTKDKPFATPARAMAAVRPLVSGGLKTDVRVVLRGGTYALAAPLVFTSADSGTADHAITYTAEPGETVVISGGRGVTNWAAAGGSKWTAELAGVKSGQWFFRQLVVNDQRAVRARWPNEDGVLHLASVDSKVKSFTFDRALPQESLDGQDAELVVYENWSVSRALVSSSDQRQLATATAVGWIGHGDMTTASPGKPAFIEHAQFALDQPREWFLDRRTGTLTYLAAPDEKPAQTVAVAPVLTQLLKIAGTKDKPVCNVRFKRLHFEHTDFPLPSIGYSEIQAAHFGSTMKLPAQVQPVAIECSYAEGIRFERCRLAHLNNSGIGFGPGCRRNAVVGCVIEDIGGNGVMVGWRGAAACRQGSVWA